MNLSDINPNLPCLRALTCSQTQKRRMSCSTTSKSTYSLSSIQSKTLSSFPILIQLCIHPDEDYSYETMKILFSSRYNYSSNVCDEFGCNLLMYTLRYQRYKLFHFLLNEISIDLNLRSKDQQGNNILHYAIIYGKNNLNIIENLIEKFKKFGIDTDERNIFGFTPLLLAIYCGRYDLVLILLTKADASPFVRDYIQLKNLLDYIEIDIKQREFLKKLLQNNQSSYLTRESIHLRIQLYQTLPYRSESSCYKIHHHTYKNFFENIFPKAVQDRTGSIRLSILKIFYNENLSTNLNDLIHYINHRYPRIKTPKKQDNSSETITTTKVFFQCENSKTNVHEIFNLFDPDLRPKAIPPKPKLITELSTSNVKTPITFKRLGAKLTVLAALSRPQMSTKSVRLITTNDKK